MALVYHDIYELIRVYVPESEGMTLDDALVLAYQRDIEAAAKLKEIAETQLRLEQAAALANNALDAAFLAKEKLILAELGYL